MFVTFQISLLLLGVLVIHSWAAPSAEDRQEVYLETCQASCGLIKKQDQIQECREKFCPNYVEYLLTGHANPNAKPSLASTNSKEVADFCATWIVQLIEQFGWQYRFRLSLKECICAAGKDCLVK